MYYLHLCASWVNCARNNLKYLPKESYNLCSRNTSYMCNPAANNMANDGIPGGNGESNKEEGQKRGQEQAQEAGSWANRGSVKRFEDSSQRQMTD